MPNTRAIFERVEHYERLLDVGQNIVDNYDLNEDPDKPDLRVHVMQHIIDYTPDEQAMLIDIIKQLWKQG